jgi:hypothetical protein
MRKLYAYFIAAVLFSAGYLNAQIIGGHCYLQRSAVQMAVASCGTFGVRATPPAGYYPNVTGCFGFVADPPRNGWTTPGPAAFPNYMGDYFTPGSPEEGFGLEFNIGATNYVYGNYQLCDTWGLVGGGIPGSIIAYNVTPTSRQAVWQGTVMGMQVTQTTTIFTDSLYILTCVNIQNLSGGTKSNVFFSRNVDPDNEQPWTGDFTTTNTIVYQQPMSPGSRALVSAVGQTHNAYLGLGTKDTRARVIHGGFSNWDPSDIWNGVGFTNTLGAVTTSDIGISIAFNLGSMPVGGCANFAYVYVLSAAQLESALNATSPSFLANSVDITSSGSTIMGCNGVSSVNLQITSGSGNCGSGSWNWTWSPAAGLSTTTGTNVTATPASTTTYTATATDNCGSVVYVQQIQIIVAPAPSVTVPSSYNYCGTPININSTPSGGTPFTVSTSCGPATAVCSGPQTTYTVGTGTVNNGTTGYPNPYGNWYWGARHQFLVRASELTAAGLTAGNIDRISFNVISTNGVTHNGFTIRLGCTSATTLSTFVTTGMSTVFGPTNHTPFVGWNSHLFSTPYFWDGTSNLIVETCFNNTSWTQNSPVNCTTMGYNCAVFFYQDALGTCTNNTVYGTSATRPNMQFRHCTTPPASSFYNYSWTPGTGLSCTNCEDPTVTPPSTPTNYTITVTDAYGCTATATTTILPCLPVTLFLQGIPQNNQNAVLSWNYPNDLSFKYFELERSKDGISYQRITTLNPVIGQDKYEYTDANLSAGTYTYRLRKVNKDGSDGYSNTVEIVINPVSEGFAVHSIAPNPAFDDVTIQYGLNVAGKVQFAVYDLTGKKLKDIYEGTISTGQYTQKFSVSDLANGNYLVVATFNGNVQHFRLNVAR